MFWACRSKTKYEPNWNQPGSSKCARRKLAVSERTAKARATMKSSANRRWALKDGIFRKRCLNPFGVSISWFCEFGVRWKTIHETHEAALFVQFGVVSWIVLVESVAQS